MCIMNRVKSFKNIIAHSPTAFDPFKQGLSNFFVKYQIVSIFSSIGRRSLLELLNFVPIVQKQPWSIFKQMVMDRIGLALVCQVVKSLNKHRMDWKETNVSIGV